MAEKANRVEVNIRQRPEGYVAELRAETSNPELGRSVQFARGYYRSLDDLDASVKQAIKDAQGKSPDLDLSPLSSEWQSALQQARTSSK